MQRPVCGMTMQFTILLTIYNYQKNFFSEFCMQRPLAKREGCLYLVKSLREVVEEVINMLGADG